MSLALSIIEMLSFLLLYVGAFLYPKTNKPLDAIVWWPIILVTTLCAIALACGCLSLARIPIHREVTSLVCFVLGLPLWILMIRQRNYQRYSISRYGLLVSAILGTVVIICVIIQFGIPLALNYETSDPAMHLWSTIQIVDTGVLRGLYLVHFCTAMLIEMLSPFVAAMSYWKIYVIADGLFLFLSGAVFFSCSYRVASLKGMRVVGPVMVVLYVLGYPLSNMVFGFGYLGFGVTIAGVILLACECFMNNEISKKWCFGVLAVCLFGVTISYSLFIPSLYLSVFLIILIYFKKNGKMLCVQSVMTLLIVFFASLTIGFSYAFLGLFSTASGASEQLATEGYIYKNLFSNSVFILPFVLFALYTAYKSKEIFRPLPVFFLVNLCVMLGVFFIGLQGMSSAYYYYKFYYLMWLFTFLLATRGIKALLDVSKTAVICYALTWAFVMFLAVSGIDGRLQKNHLLFNEEIKAWEYLDIYESNLSCMRSDDTIDATMLELFEEAESLSGDEKPVPIVTDDYIVLYWYQAVTDQNMQVYYYWLYQDEMEANLNKCDYVTVLNDSYPGYDVEGFLDAKTVVFQNAAGCIVEVRDQS